MNSFRSLIGRSPNFEALLRSAQLVSAADVTVLITGETGTGKEVLATALQQSSRRAHNAFITLNCAALPESIAESELFGHSKGAFTGAISNQTGRLQAAHEGTLFLDEVDSLSLPLQAKLLRFLETGECQPVGHVHTQHVDVRVIAATNSCLKDKVAAGLFRNDLYYRLNVVPLELPSLKDRKSDIKQLIKYFVNKFSTEHKLDPPIFNNAAITRLTNYTWPGNIRELRNLCERLCILLSGKAIGPENLPIEVSETVGKRKSGFALPALGIDLENLEKDLIHQALERTNGNRSKSARLLGISRDTLLYRIQKHKIAV